MSLGSLLPPSLSPAIAESQKKARADPALCTYRCRRSRTKLKHGRQQSDLAGGRYAASQGSLALVSVRCQAQKSQSAFCLRACVLLPPLDDADDSKLLAGNRWPHNVVVPLSVASQRVLRRLLEGGKRDRVEASDATTPTPLHPGKAGAPPTNIFDESQTHDIGSSSYLQHCKHITATWTI